MENYILQILESNNRVIVPEFGAFIVKQRNPMVIIFNEFLQYNDGMLVDFISRTDGISRDGAKEKVDAFVRKVNQELEKGNNLILPTLGTISRSATGKISVEKTEDSEIAPKKTTKSAAKKSSRETVKEDTKKTKPAESKVKESPEPEKVTETKKDQKTSVVKDEKSDAEIKKEVLPETSFVRENKNLDRLTVEEPIIKESASNEAEKKPVKTIETESVKAVTEIHKEYSLKHTPTKSGDKKKTINIIIWVLIILIVNGILIGYFVFNDEFSSLFNKKPVSSEALMIDNEELLLPEESQPADELQAKDLNTSETGLAASAPEEASLPEAKPVPDGTRFYVVAGVFRDEENAVKLVAELKKQGFNSEKFGMIGSLHAVCYDGFDNRADAEKLLEKIKQNTNHEAWIRTVR
jgi:nucleoid DNA-binding protein/cell division septation protein DedD